MNFNDTKIIDKYGKFSVDKLGDMEIFGPFLLLS